MTKLEIVGSDLSLNHCLSAVVLAEAMSDQCGSSEVTVTIDETDTATVLTLSTPCGAYKTVRYSKEATWHTQS